MSNFDISGATFNDQLRMLETTDPVHADVFNALFAQLIQNDVSLRDAASIFAKSKNEQALFLLNLRRTGNGMVSGLIPTPSARRLQEQDCMMQLEK